MAELKRKRSLLLLAIFGTIGSALFAGGASEGDLEESLSFSDTDRLTVEGVFFRVEITGHAEQSLDALIRIPARLRNRGVKVLHEKRGSEAFDIQLVENGVAHLDLARGEYQRIMECPLIGRCLTARPSNSRWFEHGVPFV